MSEPNSIGKSSSVSLIPSGTKRTDKQKSNTQNDPTRTKIVSAKLNLQQGQPLKNSSDSNTFKIPASTTDLNKNKTPFVLNITSKNDFTSESSVKLSFNPVASVLLTKKNNSDFTKHSK